MDSRTVFMTEEEYQEFHKDTLARVVRENSAHITIRKGLPFKYDEAHPAWKIMWYGYCDNCGKGWQFHFFGATLGYGLEHIRREIVGSI